MKTAELDYELPDDLIARHPAARRDESRLMRVRRHSLDLSHGVFRDLPELLRPGDLLALNDTRVFPARLLGRRCPDGGKIEVLLLHRVEEALWWGLVRPGKKIREGDRLVFAPGRLEAAVLAYGKQGGGERLLRFQCAGDWWQTLEEVGHTPLPPYILKARKQDAPPPAGAGAGPLAPSPPEEPEDRARYQTVYAGRERASVAAPTAGLHFSQEVLEALERRGVETVAVQLHVGAGTFQPIKTDRVEDHPMHAEYFRISEEAAQRINRARAEGRRVVAVGTTVVRALETAALAAQGQARGIFSQHDPTHEATGAETPEPAALQADDSLVRPLSGWTRLMIGPGFAFRAAGALLTNFHLPRSTLLLLVDAFAGKETVRAAYREAVRLRYRFYSYGDCMLIE